MIICLYKEQKGQLEKVLGNTYELHTVDSSQVQNSSKYIVKTIDVLFSGQRETNCDSSHHAFGEEHVLLRKQCQVSKFDRGMLKKISRAQLSRVIPNNDNVRNSQI